jgi:membrane associated rhomboid family serine protease
VPTDGTVPAATEVAGSLPVSSLPPVTSVLTAAMLLVAVATLGAQPVVPADALALEPSAPAGVASALWWLTHGSLGHLVTNLTVLWWVAPPLERHVGSLRSGLGVGAGILGGALVHVLVHGTAVPVLGASSVVAALAAYNLVIGWHRPLEDRRGRAVLWPSHLFHSVVAIEVVRTLGELGPGAMPTGAAAHLGGLFAGVMVCGSLHGRWPSRPASRVPVESRPVVGLLTGS